MHKQQFYAGVNWDENLYGLEIEALVLKKALLEKSRELGKQEKE
jgi:hypothetical protein